MSDHWEVHVEHLIGKRVLDVDGCVVGRIEELAVEQVGEALVVTQFHLGAEGVFERLGGMALRLPFLSRIPIERTGYRVDAALMDLSNPDRPRVTCRRGELHHGTLR